MSVVVRLILQMYLDCRFHVNVKMSAAVIIEKSGWKMFSSGLILLRKEF